MEAAILPEIWRQLEAKACYEGIRGRLWGFAGALNAPARESGFDETGFGSK